MEFWWARYQNEISTLPFMSLTARPCGLFQQPPPLELRLAKNSQLRYMGFWSFQDLNARALLCPGFECASHLARRKATEATEQERETRRALGETRIHASHYYRMHQNSMDASELGRTSMNTIESDSGRTKQAAATLSMVVCIQNEELEK
mmetsp:Transcript_32071/g.51817  ORF Transcript_32071/g.51817 Transcript_32071/m.51817 type:complete len:149 (+) Transcript_32071:1129-1575(+)